MVDKGKEAMVNPVSEKAVLVFGRLPIKGVVKTRLAAGIGEEVAFNLYEAMLSHTLFEASKMAVPIYFFYEGDLESGDAFPGIVLVRQSGIDFGQKLAFAAHYALNQLGHNKIIIIGTDCPALDEAIIEEAFFALENRDLVLGAANDGGYYLMGLTGFYPQLFENINWSSEKVASQTLENAKRIKLNLQVLPRVLSDIDTIDDLRRYVNSPCQTLVYKQIEEITRNARLERNG